MEAIEFKSKICKDSIEIPKHIKTQLQTIKDKNVRVIVLIDHEDKQYQNFVAEEFLKGYADSDDIYDQD